MFALTRARLALAQGDAARALALLDAVPRLGSGHGPGERYQVHAEIERARAMIAAGRGADAAAAAERALADLRGLQGGRLPILEARALAALGRAQAASGDALAARSSFAEAVALHEQHGPALGLWRAEAEGALAALMVASDPAASRRLLASTRRILQAHPQAGSHWRRAAAMDGRPPSGASR